jgi:hypothetical protein
MAYFMQEAKCMDDFPRKEASGKETERARERESDRERERERETFFRVARAQEFVSP